MSAARPIGAAVDVGSNSVHLLVARPARGGALEHVYEKSEFLGLGDGVGRNGVIGREEIGHLIATLGHLKEPAAGAGAEWIEIVGTAPLRRAANGAQVAAAVEAALGLPLRILSEQQEGELTFAGVTGGQLPAQALLVVDIGGGSSEVIHHRAGSDLQVASLPTGSASLTMELVRNDPPTDEEVGRLRRRAAEHVAGLPELAVERAIFCGGTPTKLGFFGPLSRPTLERVFDLARSLPAGTIASRHGLQLRRAQQLAAGAALVEALLARHRLASAEVSEASLRDGLILARLASHAQASSRKRSLRHISTR